jgi:hypothetical protein
MIAADTIVQGDNAPHPLLACLSRQVAGLAVLGSHVVLVASMGDDYLVFSMAIFISLVVLIFILEPVTGFTIFLQFFLYQNIAISLVSPDLTPPLFQSLQGSSFLLSCALAIAAFGRLWSSEGKRHDALVLSTLATVAVMIVYLLIGAQRSSLGSAAIYFRNDSVGLIGLLIGMDVGNRCGYRYVVDCLLCSLGLGIALSFFEIVTTVGYYDLVHANSYYALKYAQGKRLADFYSAADVVEQLTTVLFNLPSLNDTRLESFRFSGPNFHPVSYAYVLAVATVLAVTIRRYWFAVLTVPFLLMIGVKGPLILLIAAISLWVIADIWGAIALTVCCIVFAVSFIGGVVLYGLSYGDYHVLGLWGGINGLLHNPFGYGIGVGGNLSDKGKCCVEWQAFQHAGVSDFALESAIGVLLYQMGIGAAALGFVVWQTTRRLFQRQETTLLAITIIIVMLNALFQEEAFSPYAFGLVMLFAGVAVAAYAGSASRITRNVVETINEASIARRANNLARRRRVHL